MLCSTTLLVPAGACLTLGSFSKCPVSVRWATFSQAATAEQTLW